MGRRKKIPDGLVSARLDDAIAEYLEDRRVNSAPDAKTAPTYAVVLNGFMSLYGADKEVWTLTSQDFAKARTWFIAGASPEEAAQRKANGQKARTGRKTKSSIQGMEAVLRRFAIFCVSNQWLAQGVTLPKPVHTTTVVSLSADIADEPPEMLRVPVEDWSAILEAAEMVHPRCRAATAIGLYCARRVSEVATLRWKDIDWRGEAIRFVNWKSRRIVRVPLKLVEDELNWWADYVEENHGAIHPDWYVIPAKLHGGEVRGRGSRAFLNDGKAWPLAMDRKATTLKLNKDVRKVLAMFAIGPNEKTGTHTWRRSGAVHVERTLGLAAAQALLDHAEISEALGYTGNVEGQRALWEGATGKPYVPLRSLMPDNWEPPVTLPDNVVPMRRRRAS